MTVIENDEKGTKGTKRPYNDEGNDHAIPKHEKGPTQSYNIPTTLCTMPNLGERNMSSSQGCPVCQHNGKNSESTSTGRRPRMVGGDVKLPLYQGNGTKDPEQYLFLCKEVWTLKQVQDDDIKKGQLVMTFQVGELD